MSSTDTTLKDKIDSERTQCGIKRFVNDIDQGPFLLLGISRELMNNYRLIDEDSGDTYYLVHEDYNGAGSTIVEKGHNLYRLIYSLALYTEQWHNLYFDGCTIDKYDDEDIKEYTQFPDPIVQKMVIYFTKNMFERVHPERDTFVHRTTRKAYPSDKFQVLCTWRSGEHRYGVGDVYHLIRQN